MAFLEALASLSKETRTRWVALECSVPSLCGERKEVLTELTALEAAGWSGVVFDLIPTQLPPAFWPRTMEKKQQGFLVIERNPTDKTPGVIRRLHGPSVSAGDRENDLNGGFSPQDISHDYCEMVKNAVS